MVNKLIDRITFLKTNYVELYNSIECIITSLFENKNRMVSDNYKLTEKIQEYCNQLLSKDVEMKRINERLEHLERKYNRALILVTSKSNNTLKEFVCNLTDSDELTPGVLNEFLNRWDVRKDKIEKFDEKIARYSNNRYLEGMFLLEENCQLKNELHANNEHIQFLNEKVVNLEKQLRDMYRG